MIDGKEIDLAGSFAFLVLILTSNLILYIGVCIKSTWVVCSMVRLINERAYVSDQRVPKRSSMNVFGYNLHKAGDMGAGSI